MSRCVILGAAPFTDASVLRAYCREEDYVIAADGGQRLASAMNLVPDRVIGDFDSSECPMRRDTCTVLPVQKDDTDVLAAVRMALEHGYRDFVLLGCLGGRLDHTLANLAVLSFLQQHGAAGVLADEIHEVWLLAEGEHVVPPRPDCTVSLLPFGGDAHGVTVQHAAYPTQDAVFVTSFPIGVSNEFTEQPLMISVKSGQLLMILAKKEK